MQLAAGLLLLLPLAAAHGYIVDPPPRHDGPALRSVCGDAVADDVRRDNASHVEGLPEAAESDSSTFDPSRCNLWLCRGLQFADADPAALQVWHPGQRVRVRVHLAIPHDGRANVSLVETATNRIVGNSSRPLLVWPSGYANETLFYARALPRNNTDFEVTLPDVSATCGTPGACVLQWWWFAEAARQTYESCVDFVMGGKE